MSNKMSILESLNKQSKCPECGLSNKCAIEAGKSASTCWCMEELPKNYSVNENSCYCRACHRAK